MVKAIVTLTAFLAASAALAQPARHHAPALAGPECMAAGDALANALSHGAVAGRLDGVEAQALLDRLNAIPPATDYRADTAVVAMFRACHEADVSLRLDAFAEAWRAARGQGV